MKIYFMPLLMLVLFSCSAQKSATISRGLTSSITDEMTDFSLNDTEEITGNWILSINTPRGKRERLLTIFVENGEYKGKDEQEVFVITKTGSKISWISNLETPMGKMKAQYEAEITGKTMNGTIKAAGRTIPLNGVKK